MIGCRAFWISMETSGGCRASSMSLRTVIVGVRSRRLRMGSSIRTSIRPIWSSGIIRPSRRGEGEVGEASGIETLGASAARDDIDRPDILAHLRDRHARQQEL